MADKHQAKGDAFAELIFEVTACFFKFRAAGQLLGFVNEHGGGTVGFMRSLATRGPMTVPDLARMRPTSRQRMQQLADELESAGLIEFIDNPHHRKSKLAKLTRKGDTQYLALLQRMRDLGAALASDLAEADMRKAKSVIQHLRERLMPD
ncbi:MAG: MarR family transcriptional regulator [Alphaproteobacteria bacterium]|nr:MarR family transcriptional regulator [Alphaproteobacteria bacterium]